MAVTLTEVETLGVALEQANPNKIPTALQKVDLRRMLDPVKVTLAGLTAAAAINISALLKGAATVTINQGLAGLVAGEPLPAILSLTTLRVTTVGTATAGPRVITDAGGTPGAPGATGPGIATLSDDGNTLTFEGTVTGLVLEYIPRSATPLSERFAPFPS